MRKDLSPNVKEIEEALSCSEVCRNYRTIEVKSPNIWKEELEIVYRNSGKTGKTSRALNYLRLPKIKILPKHYSVYDKEGNSLTVVPFEDVSRALCEICEFYLFKAWESAKNDLRKVLEKFIIDIQNTDLCRIFTYFLEPEKTKEILERFTNLAKKIELALEGAPKSYAYLLRVFLLVRSYEYFHIPFVRLRSPLNHRDMLTIRISAEYRKERGSNSLRFFGFMRFSIPLEIIPTTENIIRFLPPNGMFVLHADVDPWTEGFLSTRDNQALFHIPKRKERGFVRFSAADHLRRARVIVGVSKHFPYKPSWIRILVFLMYVAAFIPFLQYLLFNGFRFEFTDSVLIFISVLALAVTYSRDKPFLLNYLTGQLAIAFIIYLLELLISLLYL